MIFSERTHTDLGIDLRSGDRLLDFVRDRGRQPPRRRDSIQVGQLRLQLM